MTISAPEMVHVAAIDRYLLFTWRLHKDFSPDDGTDLLMVGKKPQPIQSDGVMGQQFGGEWYMLSTKLKSVTCPTHAARVTVGWDKLAERAPAHQSMKELPNDRRNSGGPAAEAATAGPAPARAACRGTWRISRPATRFPCTT